MRYRMTVSYDGTDFAGWQIQPDERTVQGELTHWLGQLLQAPTPVTGAGRTDAGVHALGQVAHFDAGERLAVDDLEHHLNAALPAGIAVRSIAPVAEDFHARYGATFKTYRYRLVTRKSPLDDRHAWRPRHRFDRTLPTEAARKLVGSHDFSGFCVAKSLKEDNTCTIERAEWNTDDCRAEFTVVGDRFLHGMVRLMVGTMLDVARGRWGIERIDEILTSGDVRLCGAMAPAKGLTLMRVEYGGDAL